MNRKSVLTNAILWAAAIVAAAILGAPGVLSWLLLPSLATMSLLLVRPEARC